jgi:hypothetical protein
MADFGFDLVLLGAAVVLMAVVCAYEGWTR